MTTRPFPPINEMLQVYTGNEKPEPYGIWFLPEDGDHDAFLFFVTDTFEEPIKRIPVRVRMNAARFVKHARTYKSYMRQEVQEEKERGITYTQSMLSTRQLASYQNMTTLPTEDQGNLNCLFLSLIHYIEPEGVEVPMPFGLGLEVSWDGPSGPMDSWEIPMTEQALDALLDALDEAP